MVDEFEEDYGRSTGNYQYYPEGGEPKPIPPSDLPQGLTQGEMETEMAVQAAALQHGSLLNFPADAHAKRLSEMRRKVQLTKMNAEQRKEENRKLALKKLFIQYVKKYQRLTPDHLKRHPNQIRQKPSWFDDALELFTDQEIPPHTKRAIRDYFNGLIAYKESVEGVPSLDRTADAGYLSPYRNETVDIPGERDVGNLDIYGLKSHLTRSNVPEYPDEYLPQQSYPEETPSEWERNDSYEQIVMDFNRAPPDTNQFLFGANPKTRPSNESDLGHMMYNVPEKKLEPKPIEQTLVGTSGGLGVPMNKPSGFGEMDLVGIITGNKSGSIIPGKVSQMRLPARRGKKAKKSQMKSKPKAPFGVLELPKLGGGSMKDMVKGIRPVVEKSSPLRGTKTVQQVRKATGTKDMVSGIRNISKMVKVTIPNKGDDSIGVRKAVASTQKALRKSKKESNKAFGYDNLGKQFEGIENIIPRVGNPISGGRHSGQIIKETGVLSGAVTSGIHTIDMRGLRSVHVKPGELSAKNLSLPDMSINMASFGLKKKRQYYEDGEY